MKPAIARPGGNSSAEARAGTDTLKPSSPARSEEPRTGVVRKVNVQERKTSGSTLTSEERREAGSGIRARASIPSSSPSSRSLISNSPTSSRSGVPAPRGDRPASRSSDWSCLEWGERKSEPSSAAAPRVSIAQITSDGELLRQSGPDEALPETAEFVHRVSTLIAQSLGFKRCRAFCLRGRSAALSVSEAGHGKVVSVTGPLRQMTNVLRRMELE